MTICGVNRVWEKYKWKQVVVNTNHGMTNFSGRVIGIDEDGWMLVESTDGWCFGHDGGVYEPLVFGEKPDSKKAGQYYYVPERNIKIVENENFIMI